MPASGGRDAGLSGMVNTGEPLINIVKLKRAKDADRLEPKGKQRVSLDSESYTELNAAGGKTGPNLLMLLV